MFSGVASDSMLATCLSDTLSEVKDFTDPQDQGLVLVSQEEVAEGTTGEQFLSSLNEKQEEIQQSDKLTDVKSTEDSQGVVDIKSESIPTEEIQQKVEIKSETADDGEQFIETPVSVEYHTEIHEPKAKIEKENIIEVQPKYDNLLIVDDSYNPNMVYKLENQPQQQQQYPSSLQLGPVKEENMFEKRETSLVTDGNNNYGKAESTHLNANTPFVPSKSDDVFLKAEGLQTELDDISEIIQRDQENDFGPASVGSSIQSSTTSDGGLNLLSDEFSDYSDISSNNTTALDYSRMSDTSDSDLRPEVSYVEMVAQCIMESPERKVALNDIYEYLERKYPYFKHTKAAWKNSVRHHLSTCESFVKVGRVSMSRGYYWGIHPNCVSDFLNGKYDRKLIRSRVGGEARQRKRARKDNERSILTIPGHQMNQNMGMTKCVPILPKVVDSMSHIQGNLSSHSQPGMINGVPMGMQMLGPMSKPMNQPIPMMPPSHTSMQPQYQVPHPMTFQGHAINTTMPQHPQQQQMTQVQSHMFNNLPAFRGVTQTYMGHHGHPGFTGHGVTLPNNGMILPNNGITLPQKGHVQNHRWMNPALAFPADGSRNEWIPQNHPGAGQQHGQAGAMYGKKDAHK